MRTHTKKLAAIALALLMLLALAGCSGGKALSGTYKSQDIIPQTFTFSGEDEVAIGAFGIAAQGTYEIKDGEIAISYSLLGVELSWSSTFEKDGDSIFINGTEFVKE